MVRQNAHKYVRYMENYPPQLFDLSNDPLELHDLAGDPAQAGSLSACETALEGLIDPAAVDRAAKADQEERLALGGGIEAIIEQGSLGYTPAPGETPEYM